MIVEPNGSELIARYKNNYAIPADAAVTEEMILEHWELEKRLTRELLDSDPENRWQVFDKCYSELYRQLAWLNEFVDADDSRNTTLRFARWLKVIGNSPQRIYEIGSGKAELIFFLAQNGHTCKATEITRERGQDHTDDIPNLTWGVSDGIHLDQFEPRDYYDVVLSNQVIEHLHPDDVVEHFKGVLAILSSDGRYIFCVPHRCAGPADISSVFGCDEPSGMHLREYTYGELQHICYQAGYRKVTAILSMPVKFEKIIGRQTKPVVSSLSLSYSQALESVLLLLPPSSLRRKLARLMRILFFDPSIFMVAMK